jgi:hypothetical protein
MVATMRAALLMMLLSFGCSNKSETKQESAPTPAPKADEQKTPEVKAPSPTPAPAPAPNVPDVRVDCATLVTPADVAKACGGANVEVAVSEHEGKNPALGACWRILTEPGKKFPVAQIYVNAFADAAGADSWMKLEKTPETKDVAGIGETAWSREAAIAGTKTTELEIGVRKGRLGLRVTSAKGPLNKNPPCDLAQLTELARILAPRLP